MNESSFEGSSKSRVFFYYEKYMMVVGVLGQLLYYFQGIKILITKSAGDISILGFLFGFVSVSSWLIYGMLIKNKILIIANAFAVIGALLVIAGVLIHRA